MTRIIPTIAVAAGALVLAAASPAAARTRHRHHAAAPPQAEAPSRPFMFYPQEIEGGSTGNLPFNNQIRKHTDGLNANGGR